MPFEIGREYRRAELHQEYGGQQQGGISTPSSNSAGSHFVLLFTGDSGEQYGYQDGWDARGFFLYTGEGQVGDMQFVRGNLAIRDHEMNGKELHLFRSIGRGMVEYVGEMSYFAHRQVRNVPDRHGNPRTAIQFVLMPVHAP